MGFPVCLLLSVMIGPASLMPSPNNQVIGVHQERKDITEINKDLNLFEGDIILSGHQRSAVLDVTFRWNKYVPYVLNASLSLNDKGIILRAFEQLRLKACIDFKPRTTEQDYISVESLNGCWSYIGKQSKLQQLSIGIGCASVGIVEHEFLHALGFFHEQSRYDRDDNVAINFGNIISGKEGNFEKMSKSISTIQGTPYDYMSVMHYSKNAFSKGNGSTIVTKQPEFQDVIGQRYDISYWDAYELNSLYTCVASVSFLDRCSFDNEFMCQMSTCMSASSNNTQGWKRVSIVSGGPLTDRTYLSKQSAGPGFFMHFSTKGGKAGDSGRMESTIMTPKRDCHVQCLEFFYYHTANERDQLNIWIREYQNAADLKGTLRLMDHITGPPTSYWQLHHVPLNTDKQFLVEFEARAGGGMSTGGFSVDDINLSETPCPHIWQIRNVFQFVNHINAELYSPLYYSPEGYRYQAVLRLNEKFLEIYVRLVSGINDGVLKWPCLSRQVTFVLLDQNPHIQQRMSHQMSFTTSSTAVIDGKNVWDNPRQVGDQIVTGDNETVYANYMRGYSSFFDRKQLSDREFVKGDDLIILLSMQDISTLQLENSLPCSTRSVKPVTVSPYNGAENGSCTPRNYSGDYKIHSSITLLVASLVLLALN